jgi:shikimate dehydrogenase
MRFFPRVRYWKLALDFSDYNFKQVLEALQFIKSLPESWQNKIVFIPMGVKWTALRLWASCCFGALLFSCYHERGALAQGQPTLEAALAFQREFREGDFYALLGSSVNQSPSHISHNLAFHKLCEKARYLKLALEQEELEVFLKAASCLGIRGCSVTLPYKELAFENAATASSLASEVRAANLLCLTESGWYADNTDARAFIDLFELLKVDFNSHVLVLGSGGSAKAALVALVKKRACIDIVSRQLERALKAREDILPWIEAADPDQVQCHSFQNSPVWIHKKYDIIIQSTPLGMRAFDQYPFAFEDLHSQATLIELVNGPSLDKLETGYFHPTALSSYWQSKGRCVIEAKGFFTRQASYQFEAWIGCDKRLGYELLEAYFNPY